MKSENSVWNPLINRYSVSKTLRFELRPVGKTLENIKTKELIEEDEERAKEFKQVKDIMDDYYRFFIEKCLSKTEIKEKDLIAYRKRYDALKKDRNNVSLKKQYEKNQATLRLIIYNSVKSVDPFNKLFKKEFIKKILPTWLENNNRYDDLTLVKRFSNWTTYFTGFFDNRKNVFSKDEIPTSIIYRIVHENLPRFLDNLERFEILSETEGFDYRAIEEKLKENLRGHNIKNIISLRYFCSCLNQEGIDKYNRIIGGQSTEDGKKIQGLNELINEFSQKQSEKNIQKKIRKMKLNLLYKQMLSDRKTISFSYDTFNNDKETITAITDFYKHLDTGHLISLKSLLSKLSSEETDLKKIYLRNSKGLSRISQSIFGSWNTICIGLKEYARTELNIKTDKALEKWYKGQTYFSIYEIEESIKKLELHEDRGEHPVCDYINKMSKNDKILLAEIDSKYSEIKKLELSDKKVLLTKKGEKNLVMIKKFLDSIIDLFHFIKPLHLKTEVLEHDAGFYHDFNALFDELKGIIPLYNMVRNYSTQKPFSTKKFKLNFRNSTLAAGWDINKEVDNWSVLLRRDGMYYLGIMSDGKGNNKVFEEIPEDVENSTFYEKINYKLLPGPNKMLPKVFFSKKNIEFYAPSDKIVKIRNQASYTKNGKPQNGFVKKDFNLSDCHAIIDFYKRSLEKHPEWSVFNFSFKPTSDYKDISEFYREVSTQGYKLSFRKISEEYINNLVDEGRLYLFQLWNKDFSKYSKGKPNLHTLYWRELFSENNLKDIVYKLNGEAEIFYRRKSIERKITHPKNIPIKNKDPIKNKNTSIFEYDLIKNKRYTKDKFFFHCPITLNFKSDGNGWEISRLVNRTIKEKDKQVCVLGIDRGERHLAYYTLLDPDGKILKQGSFNKVKDDINREKDYHKKLAMVEGARDEARKNWKKIANIKELKEGYLSNVIHTISRIAVESNAIIVLEDLNSGFKRGRFKIEKQVYQKFEKMLIDKLNYLVFKDIKDLKTGSTLKAYQLTNKFDSFKKLGRQSGIIYYVDAYKTSKICPKTGFVNLIYPRFENIKKSKDFFKKFKNIRYNHKEGLFEFSYNNSDFSRSPTKKEKLAKDSWTIYSNGTKLIKYRNKEKNQSWETKKVNPSKELKDLFREYNLPYISGKDIREGICNQGKKDFFERLTWILRVILQLRNSYTKSEVEVLKRLSPKTDESEYDYILSCVKDKDGQFFDSRTAKNGDPKDADANGAFNIARKGLMLIDKIKASEEEKPDLRIKRDEFIDYVTSLSS